MKRDIEIEKLQMGRRGDWSRPSLTSRELHEEEKRRSEVGRFCGATGDVLNIVDVWGRGFHFLNPGVSLW